MVEPMVRRRVAAATLFIVMMVAAMAGCAIVGRDVLEPSVGAMDPVLADSSVVAATKPSVVKISGLADGCQQVLEGTGFVVSPNRVMSNAHTVAGTDRVTVESNGDTYDAQVISYDPNADISILDVPDLPAPPLSFADGVAKSSADAVILGYPDGGEFVATPARIREVIELHGPDLYRTTAVTRETYTVSGEVKTGDSGGPLIDLQGRVLGVIFGTLDTDGGVGVALTAGEVAPQLAKVANTEAVPTGACVS